MTATTADELFKQAVTPVLDAVGAYPRAEPSKSVKPKQGTRLQCPACAMWQRQEVQELLSQSMTRGLEC
jgi:hypothetical protein